MSKCKDFNPKFIPLIHSILSGGYTTEKSIIDKLGEFFESPEIWLQEYNTYLGISNNLSSALPVETTQENIIEQKSKVLNTEVATQDSTLLNGTENTSRKIVSQSNLTSTKMFFINNNSEKAAMETQFRKEIAARTIVDYKNATTIKSEDVDSNLIQYKKLLIEQLEKNFGSVEALTDEARYTAVMDKVETSFNENGGAFNTDYLPYVQLKWFDELLASEAPYIQKTTKTDHPLTSGSYVLDFKDAKHHTGFKSKDFYVATENLSSIMNVVLTTLPQVDASGNDVLNSFVGKDGFFSVMGDFKEWITSKIITDIENRSKYTAFYENPQEFDWKKYLAEFAKNYNNNTNVAKLKGIQTYLFNSNKSIIDSDVLDVIKYNAVKMSQASYISYEVDDTTGRVTAKLLDERLSMLERLEFNNSITGTQMLLNLQPLEARVIQIDGETIKLFSQGEELTLDVNSACETTEDKKFVQQMVDALYLGINIDELQKYDYNILSTGATYFNTHQRIFRYLNHMLLNVDYGEQNKNIKVSSYPIASALTRMKNKVSQSVIKNQEGNNLPITRLPSLASSFQIRWKDIANLDASMFHNSLSYRNASYIPTSKIRSSISIGKKTLQPSELSAADALHVGIVYDFFDMLDTKKQHKRNDSNSVNGIIGLQPVCFADKSMQYSFQFDINKTWSFKTENGDESINLLTLVNEVIANKSPKAANKLQNLWRNNMGNRYDYLVNQIIDDYDTVYGNVNNLQDVQKIISTETKTSLISKFYANGVPCVEEVHYCSKKAKGNNPNNIRFNESIEYIYNITRNPDKFNEFVNHNLSRFKDYCVKNWDTFKSDDSFGQMFKTKSESKEYKNLKSFVSSETINNQIVYSVDLFNVKGELNPVVLSYFLIDNLISDDFSSFMTGDFYSHASKAPSDDTIEHHLANRYIAQSKRMVSYGATYHPFMQGLKYGVLPKVKIAVIEDVQAFVQNYEGDFKKIDAHDGSMLVSPYFSLQENASLQDAAVGMNKKTLYNDVDPVYGTQILLKMAEFAITNQLRRAPTHKNGRNTERLFKRMHSIPITTEQIKKVIDEKKSNGLLYEKELSNYGYKNPFTGEITHIKKIQIYYSEFDNGDIKLECCLNDDTWVTDEINTIYDIDKVVGGAWCIDTTNESFSNESTNLVNDIIVELGLKDNMIAFVANKSAIKAGATNINPTSSQNDESDLMYMEMSTEYGGVQMSSDHDLEDIEVREATQMITALAQGGKTTHIVQKIYQTLSDYINLELEPIKLALEKEDNADLYNIYEKELIKAFKSGQDTIGLAQAFIQMAEGNAYNISHNIPFSSNSINGKFSSTVAVSLIKKAIRRHYDGGAFVLNPSFGIMQYHTIGNKTELFENIVNLPEVQKAFSDGWTVDALMTQFKDNPFVEQRNVEQLNLFDSIFINNELIYIDSYEKYLKYKYEISHTDDQIFVNTFAPKDLQGTDTKYTIVDENGVNKTYSMYDNIYSRAAFYLNKNKLLNTTNVSFSYFVDKLQKSEDPFWKNTENVNLLREALHVQNDNAKIPSIKKSLTFNEQQLLNALSTAKQYIDINNTYANVIIGGKELLVSNVENIASEVVIGRKFAKQFGLKSSDSISDILSNPSFFYKRAASSYELNANDEMFIATLFDGGGSKINIRFDDMQVDISGYNLNDDYAYVKNNETTTILYLNEEILTFKNDISDVQFYINNEGQQYVHITGNDDDKLKILNDFSKNSEYGFYHWHSDWNGVITQNGQTIQEYQKTNIKNKIANSSKGKYAAFKKSLNLIGIRIPCQSMTSFMKMKIVAFCDSEVTDLYVSTMTTYLQGSDYDIDKQYVISYSFSPNGKLYKYNDANSAYKNKYGLKNQTMDDIHAVLEDPSNQLHLTQPVTMENFEELALGFPAGNEAKSLSPYDRFSKYILQEQNALGKSGIGIYATGIKAYFTILYNHNKTISQIVTLIQEYINNPSDEYLLQLNDLVDRIYKSNDSIVGTYTDELEKSIYKLDEIALQNSFNEDLIKFTKKIKLYIADQRNAHDASALLGEGVNAAADNAKVLILRKINSDKNWSGLYIYGIVTGKSLEEIALLMKSSEMTTLVEKLQQSLWDPNNVYKDVLIKELADNATTEESKNTYSKIKKWMRGAEELRILGSILKINQGLATDPHGRYKYIQNINTYIKKSIPAFDFIDFLSNDEKQKKYINSYESKKNIVNILDVITNTEHINSMLQAVLYDYEIVTRLSKRNKAEYNNAFNNSYSETGPKTISLSDFNDIRKNINRDNIIEWIKSKNFTFTMPVGTSYETSTNITVAKENKEITIVDDDTLKQFKKYMEMTVIPNLIKSVGYRENEFVKNLMISSKLNAMKTQTEIVFKLPFNMMEIANDEKLSTQYDRIHSGFNDIRNDTLSDISLTIQDAFFLYNLYVYLDQFSHSSMTVLFDDTVLNSTSNTNDNQSWVLDYNWWLDEGGFQEAVVLESSDQANNDDINDTSLSLETQQIEKTESSEIYDNWLKEYSDVRNGKERHETTRKRIQKDFQTYQANWIVGGQLNLSKAIALFGENVQTITRDELLEGKPELKINDDVNAFILDGVVYFIEEDLPLNVYAHEIAHVLLAQIKSSNDPKTLKSYYKLLENVKDTEVFAEMYNNKDKSAYKYTVGSDFSEEVLVRILSEYLSTDGVNQTNSSNISNIIKNSNDSNTIGSILLKLVDITTNDNLDQNEIDNWFGILKQTQEVSSFRSKLFEDEKITENCK